VEAMGDPSRGGGYFISTYRIVGDNSGEQNSEEGQGDDAAGDGDDGMAETRHSGQNY
jgi:hypothetical protein